MRNSNGGNDDRGNFERLGESAGAMAGRVADFGMEVTGALFRSAAEMLGGWWSSDAPRQAASSWSDRAETDCRSHFQASAGAAGSTSGGAGGSVGMSASGSAPGATQATRTAPKSTHAAMQSDTGESGSGTGGAALGGSAQIGDTRVSGSARIETSSERGSSAGGSGSERSFAADSVTDGFERARPGYQLGYVARQNPAYRGRSFSEIEPELQRVWESRAKTQGGATGATSSWPEVRGYVDFAYQQGGE